MDVDDHNDERRSNHYPNGRRKADWHLNKRVGISHILTSVLLAFTVFSTVISGILAFKDIDSRVKVLEKSQEYDENRSKRIEQKIDRIDDKLDTFIRTFVKEN